MAGSDRPAVRRSREGGRSRYGGSPAPARNWLPACAGMTNRPVFRWGLAILLALAFKAFYAEADAGQLQWLLRPLAELLNLLGGFAFRPTPGGEWLDAGHGLVIVKACAGGNFLIASWLGYLWRRRGQPFGPAALAGTLVSAWLTTLVANALRIVLIAYGQGDVARLAGLSDADAHRLIGIAVYLGCLWLQLAGTGTVLVAPAIYLGVVLFVPMLHAWLSGLSGIDTGYVVWTMLTPLTGLLVYGLSRLCFRRGA
jgi:exosortase K